MDRGADRDRRGRRRVQRRRRQLLDEPAAGLRARRVRQPDRGLAALGAVQPGDRLRVPAHAARRLHGGRLRARLDLRDRDAPQPGEAKRSPPPARAADPAHGRRAADAGSDLRRRRRGARGRRPPAREVRRLRMHLRDRARPDRVARRDLHRRRGQVGDRHPRSRLDARRVQHRHRRHRARPDPRRRGAARAHAPPPRLRHDGRDRLRAAGARRLARVLLVAQARLPGHEVVPASGRAQRHRRGGRHGGGLDRHRGGSPAVDRPGPDAHRGRGDERRRPLVRARRRDRPLRGARRDRGRLAAADREPPGADVGAGLPYGPPAKEPGR